MKVNVSAKGRNNLYSAKGIYSDAGFIVLKGSRISAKIGSKLNPIAEKIRADRDKVSNDYIVLDDIVFRSPSTAATFVTGHIANGNIVWKLDSGKPLGSIMPLSK